MICKKIFYNFMDYRVLHKMMYYIHIKIIKKSKLEN